MSYYIIKSKLNGLVLDVKKGETTSGAHVITYTQHGKDNQIWYDDVATGTIRSKQTGLCMDIHGDTLVVKEYKVGEAHQQWERQGAFIKNRKDQKKALDIFGENKALGAKVGIYAFNGKANQQWDFEPVHGASAVPSNPIHHYATGRPFLIVSEMNHKVVDIQAGSPAPDAKAILWTKNPALDVKNQQWHLDSQGFIHSVLNDFVFQSKDVGHALKMTPFAANNNHGLWTIDGKKIVNRNGECLDVKGDNKEDGAELCAYKYKGSANQHWTIQYV